MTMTKNTFSTTLMAAIFALAFSGTMLLGAIGPAVDVAPSTQSYAA